MKRTPTTFKVTQLPDALECGQAKYTAVISFDSPANSRPRKSKDDISVQPGFHIPYSPASFNDGVTFCTNTNPDGTV